MMFGNISVHLSFGHRVLRESVPRMAKPTHGCLCAPAYVLESVVLAVLGQIAEGESPRPELLYNLDAFAQRNYG